MSERFTGSCKPTPGGLKVGYEINDSEMAHCGIALVKGDTLEQKESNIHMQTDKCRVGLKPDYFYAEEHMGPEPEEDA